MDPHTTSLAGAARAQAGQLVRAAVALAGQVAPARAAKEDVRSDAVKVLDLLIEAGELDGQADALERGFLILTPHSRFTATHETTLPKVIALAGDLTPEEAEAIAEVAKQAADDEGGAEVIKVDGLGEFDLIGDTDTVGAEDLENVDALLDEATENG